jgi:predicted DNA-binding protein with PD1-like motif
MENSQMTGDNRRQLNREVQHPGPPMDPRILSLSAGAGREFRLFLPAGADLLEGLAETMLSLGVSTAGVRLSGGQFDAFSFYTGVEDPTGARVATFSPPHNPLLPVTLVIANVIIGLDENEQLKSHCHAAFLDGDGSVLGGHLIPGKCRIGAGGLVAWVTTSGEAQLKVRHDPETNFPIFHPHDGAPR